MIISKKLYKLFLYVFLILMFIISLATIFDNKSLIATVSPIYLIIGTIVSIIFYFLIYKLIISRLDNISKKKEIIIVTVLFLIITILQVSYIYFMATNPNWDWNDVFSAAGLYASGLKDQINWEYFQMFPNNNAILTIETIIFKIVNMIHISQNWHYYYLITISLNIICIDISILLI